MRHRKPQPLRSRRLLRRGQMPHPRQPRHYGEGPQFCPQYLTKKRCHQCRQATLGRRSQPRSYPGIQRNLISVGQPWGERLQARCSVFLVLLRGQVTVSAQSAQHCRDISAIDGNDISSCLVKFGGGHEGRRHILGGHLHAEQIAGHVVRLRDTARRCPHRDHLR